MVGPPTIYHLFIVATDGLVTQPAPGPDNYFNELNIFHSEQTLIKTPGYAFLENLSGHKPLLANVAQQARVQSKGDQVMLLTEGRKITRVLNTKYICFVKAKRILTQTIINTYSTIRILNFST